jgi:hypothetical protein
VKKYDSLKINLKTLLLKKRDIIVEKSLDFNTKDLKGKI